MLQLDYNIDLTRIDYPICKSVSQTKTRVSPNCQPDKNGVRKPVLEIINTSGVRNAV